VRILLVSHPPLTAELGAAQLALSLAAALRERGHDALAWSPEPLPPGSRWDHRARQRRAIEAFVAEHGPFDVIDTPPTTASRRLARQGRLVARSIQPELGYLACDLAADLRRRSPRVLAHALGGATAAAAILAGWRRAQVILCLGSLELAWMRRRFPRWSRKMGFYLSAPSTEERAAVAKVRRQRSSDNKPRDGVRFLWIGRWAAHKGTERLRRFLAARLPASPADTVTLAGCGEAPARDLPADWLRSGRIRLVPSFARADLSALLAAHDAGLFTSEVEGWGLSLNEMLESGMPVFATEAGAVADLRPWFPNALRPFPPPEGPLEMRPLEDLAANGYYERFDWSAIASDYERQVCRRGGDGHTH
jgi:glycosyltransferase involved in cell wall biosynthesis